MTISIQLKRSETPGSAPSAASLVLGELAINVADGRVFLKKASGEIVDITSIAGINGLTAALAGKLDVDGDGSALTNLNASAISTGTISAARVPTLNQNTTGSAATLTTARTINGTAFNGSVNITTGLWGTARTISYTGDVTGSASVNGSANVAFTMTLANSGVTAGTYPKVTVDAKGRVTAGAALAASDIPALDASKVTSGTFAAARIPTLNQNTTGSAATLTTARTLAATGDATWSVSFNGSANVSAALTLSATGVSAGTYPKVTVDTKGRVTAGASLVASDIPDLDASKITSGEIAVPVALGGGDTLRFGASPGSPSLPDYNVFGLAMFKADSNVTGAIVFSAPSANTAVMHQFEIDAYNYSPTKVEKILVSGYRYGTGWLSTTKMAFGSIGIQVRLGVDASGKNCIILGDETTVWQYPQVAISRAMLTFSGVSTAYTKGWTTALVTDLSGFSGLTGFLSDATSAIDTSGNAATATALATARTLSASGDATWSVSFNGTANATAALTLASTGVAAGTYPKVTVDAKGRVTAGASLSSGDLPSHTHSAADITSGVLDTARLPPEALVGDTTYSNGVGLSLSSNVFSILPATASAPGGVKLGSDTEQTVAPNAVTATASRSYAVQMNVDQQLVVNVPWTNTTYSEISEAEITTGTASTARAISARRLTFALSSKADVGHTHPYLPLAGGTMTGAITFDAGQTWPTFNQSTTGNAATATQLATARTIGGVSFDGSANINLPGVNATGNQNTTGSAASLTTARSITATGDGSWTVSFNGSANVSAAFTLANSGVTAGTYPKVTVDAKGRVTAGAALAAADVPNLDAAKITSGTFAAARIPTLNQNTTGSAASLTTARTITATGDGSWSVSFNGTSNVSAAFTLANSGVTAGTYSKVTVDAKGRVTAGAALVAGDIPTLNQNTTGNAATATQWATARTLTIGNTGKAVSGAANVTWTLAEIGAAGLASPAFTGTPTAPTATAGTNTTQIATTAFVTAAVTAAAGIEYGGSPSDVTASRSLDTVYTNTSGKMLLVYYRTTSGASRIARLVVNGGAAYVGASTGPSVNSTSTVYAIVPPGGTYEATGGTGAVADWVEMELV